jgi:hypothetical protein
MVDGSAIMATVFIPSFPGHLMTETTLRIPDIQALPRPAILPHSRSMASHKENETTYDPQMWELEYVLRRYLGRVDEQALRARYDAIARNMRAIISEDRHVIPIQSFLSSWYWYRKEHQTRLEFALRKLPLDRELPVIAERDLRAAPARPRHPNGGDVLFRYGERKWLHELVQSGRLRIKAARDYALIENDPARKDDEVVKHSYSPGEYVRFTLPDGRTSRPIGDLRYSVTGTDYYVYCVANDWDPDLFSAFNADACVVIHKAEEFARRFNAAAFSKLGDWYFHYGPVEYFDTHERRPHERIDNAMSKDFRFAYQRETRFVWAGRGRRAAGFIDLELGPLKDIASLTGRP